ncbi:imelysin family protein [Bdellovibrio sp. 22V]|uniref:imelysin family protein n=1 Tax=Bdellovibrio sp. 22V TaxID=3044166 RepID=UPI0025439872|nr:imelysin family protein [Bdellovibrio sp. 22V]WII73503.1 imelysin family protein [Bdellovibrio sp. 22V]
MQSKSLVLKASLAVATCLLTASCADFFQSEKSSPSGPGTNGTQSGGGSLPPEFQKPNEGSFSEQKMLINIGTNVIARAVDNFNTQVPVLKNSLRQYCETLATGASARREETQAQLDWERVMLAFHEIEAAPFGPLMDNGRYLNDYMYSWPYLNTCDIDKKVFEHSQTPVTADRLLFNVRGLSALEYLLFEKSYKSTCNLRANPTMAEWNARSEQQKKLDRCQWAQELVKDVQAKAQDLQFAWAIESGNFTKTMIDGSRYSSMKESINALTDALAHIEKLKDTKLGKPTARHKDCTEDKCPKDVEHLYSGLSLASAEAQLKGFKAIFTGSYSNQPGFGLDDLLIQSGRADVSEKVIAALDQALRSLRAAQDNGTLKEQVEAMDSALCKATTMTDRKVEICAVHADVREVAFLLKTEVLAALALRAPPTHQGDND